jgi:bacillithiol synthase
MECHCLRNHDIPHTTRLYSTFTEDFSKVAEFYSHSPDETGIRAAAKGIRLDERIRREVAGILREQNQVMGSGAATEKNIVRLKRGAVAVVTGQQVGLFGGPAYTVYKALSALHWAERLTRAGFEAVPVFWMATEDHDIAEVNHVFWSGEGKLAKIELPVDKPYTGQSVGRIPLGGMIRVAVDHAVQLLDGVAASEIASALAVSYREGETYGSAFGKLLARLFAGRGLILLDPLDGRLHELSRPIYRRAIEESGEIVDEILARDKVLNRRGYHAQVKVARESTLLFLELEGKREPVRRRKGEFHVGGMEISRAELCAKLEAQPEAFTASVLLRPVVQDALLPTAAYVGGAAEVAYYAQAQVVYQHVLGRMPAILPRASFTLIEPQVARLLKKYDLEFGDVLRGRQHVRRRMELKYLPRGLASRFVRDEKALRSMWKGYRKAIARLDQSLTGALDTAERKTVYQFEKLRGKAGRAENFRTGVLDRHETQILSALFPHRGLQERSLSLLPLLAHQGAGLLDQLYGEMDKSCSEHRILSL